MNSTEEGGFRRISANLPQKLIDGVDQLKIEWGLRSRGAVIERLLDDVFSDINESDTTSSLIQDQVTETDLIKKVEPKYSEDKAIILIGKSDIEITINHTNNELPSEQKVADSPAINLPGFVSRRTTTLRQSLKNSSTDSGLISFAKSKFSRINV